MLRILLSGMCLLILMPVQLVRANTPTPGLFNSVDKVLGPKGLAYTVGALGAIAIQSGVPVYQVAATLVRSGNVSGAEGSDIPGATFITNNFISRGPASTNSGLAASGGTNTTTGGTGTTTGADISNSGSAGGGSAIAAGGFSNNVSGSAGANAVAANESSAVGLGAYAPSFMDGFTPSDFASMAAIAEMGSPLGTSIAAATAFKASANKFLEDSGSSSNTNLGSGLLAAISPGASGSSNDRPVPGMNPEIARVFNENFPGFVPPAPTPIIPPPTLVADNESKKTPLPDPPKQPVTPPGKPQENPPGPPGPPQPVTPRKGGGTVVSACESACRALNNMKVKTARGKTLDGAREWFIGVESLKAPFLSIQDQLASVQKSLKSACGDSDFESIDDEIKEAKFRVELKNGSKCGPYFVGELAYSLGEPGTFGRALWEAGGKHTAPKSPAQVDDERKSVIDSAAE
jgi:hypothetical protein